MKKLLVLIVALTVASCKDKISENAPLEVKIDSVTESVSLVIPDSIQSDSEDFDVFFMKFNTDSLFQVSRIEFPLEAEFLDMGTSAEPKNKKVQIKNSEYNILDLTPDSLMYEFTRKKVKKGKDKIIIEERGRDNGVYSNYIFKKIEGKWRMVSWIDQSA